METGSSISIYRCLHEEIWESGRISDIVPWEISRQLRTIVQIRAFFLDTNLSSNMNNLITFAGLDKWPRVILLWWTHGNEISGINACSRIIDDMISRVLLISCWELLVVSWVNEVAIKNNVRWIKSNDGSVLDMNRFFRPNPPKTDWYEYERSRKLMPLKRWTLIWHDGGIPVIAPSDCILVMPTLDKNSDNTATGQKNKNIFQKWKNLSEIKQI